jgi:hypothetical protein
MITKFNCLLCGNYDHHKATYYDGALGYEATYCACCGAYYDHTGFHLPDESSKGYVRFDVPDIAIKFLGEGLILNEFNVHSRIILNNIDLEWTMFYIQRLKDLLTPDDVKTIRPLMNMLTLIAWEYIKRRTILNKENDIPYIEPTFPNECPYLNFEEL